MSAEYRLTANPDVVQRASDTAFIVNGGAGWAEYQAWLEAGGVPDPLPLALGSSHYDWGERFVETIGRY